MQELMNDKQNPTKTKQKRGREKIGYEGSDSFLKGTSWNEVVKRSLWKFVSHDKNCRQNFHWLPM